MSVRSVRLGDSQKVSTNEILAITLWEMQLVLQKKKKKGETEGQMIFRSDSWEFYDNCPSSVSLSASNYFNN